MIDPDVRRAHALFMRALAMEPSERERFVREDAADAPEVMARVLALLESLTADSDFLEPVARSEFSAVVEESLPSMVGSYLIVGVLGSGGMATVYEAIQEQPRRRVALKVMHQRMSRAEGYTRFLFETEALARLRHPGIAQIFEAGAAPIGGTEPVPFFAMELVPDALPITTYVRNNGLSREARVTLLAEVCDAVHHGHQNGVIHRDIKPANVLVDGGGRARVIDFGVARATESRQDSPTGDAPIGRLVGTLATMSPEQCVASGPIDFRTDVYALGVLLYEMICDRPPYDLSGLPLPAALQVIMHEPVRPANLGPGRAARDLSAIVLKALEKEPSRRYDSASALAADLRHWLSDMPIDARPPTLIDQCRLFSRRYRGTVLAAGAVAASLVLVSVISAVFAVRLSEEAARRKAAESQALEERDAARWQAYTARIGSAVAALGSGNLHRLRRELAHASTADAGWEWGYLARIAEGHSHVVVEHSDRVVDLAVDRSWKRAVVVGGDGEVLLVEIPERRVRARFVPEGGARAVSAALCGPGENFLVIGDDRGAVHLHELSNAKNIRRIGTLSAPVRTVRVFPDGRVAAAASDGSWRIWDSDGSTSRSPDGDQPGGVRGIEVSPDGLMFATYNDRGHVWIRNVHDASVIARHRFPSSVRQVCFAPETGLFAVAGTTPERRGRVSVWRIGEEEPLHIFDADPGVLNVRVVAFTSQGRELIAGLVPNGARVLRMSDGAVIANLTGHTEAIVAARCHPDDHLLLTASWDHSVRSWRMKDVRRDEGGSTLRGHGNWVIGVSFTGDGTLLASSSLDGSVRLWDPDFGTLVAALVIGSGAEGQLSSLVLSPDGTWAAAAAQNGRVARWCLVTGESMPALGSGGSRMLAVAITSDGAHLAAGSANGRVHVWRTLDDALAAEFIGHEGSIYGLAFSPCGTLLASASQDGTIRLWDLSAGAERSVLRGHGSDVMAVAFTSDGRLLLSGSRDQSLRVWEVESSASLRVVADHGQYLTSLTLSPDGRRLAAGSWSGEVLLFDVESFDLLAGIPAHRGTIRSLSFSSDGRWLATGSYDGTVRLLDSASREEAATARRQREDAVKDAMVRAAPWIEEFGGDPQRLRSSFVRDDPMLRRATLTEMTARSSD